MASGSTAFTVVPFWARNWQQCIYSDISVKCLQFVLRSSFSRDYNRNNQSCMLLSQDHDERKSFICQPWSQGCFDQVSWIKLNMIIKEDTGFFSHVDSISKFEILQATKEKVTGVLIIPPDKSIVIYDYIIYILIYIYIYIYILTAYWPSIRSVLWNIRPRFFRMDRATINLCIFWDFITVVICCVVVSIICWSLSCFLLTAFFSSSPCALHTLFRLSYQVLVFSWY